MRFDFSHSKALTPDDIQAVEDEVNSRIRRNAEVTTRLMTPEGWKVPVEDAGNAT